jgi:hypothetical protein
MTADLKNEAQKALDAYDKYESHRDALQFAAAIESLRKAVELQAPAEGDVDLSERGRRHVAGLRSIRARHALSQEEHGALTVAIEVMRKSPEVPTNEALEKVASGHQGHPADFAADVLERWGGWQHGLMGYGGGLNATNPDVQPKGTEPPRCQYCDGTGDVHSPDGRWLGECNQCPEAALHAFKNFHRLLCERFGYGHDEKDWRRDQLSLIEFIAAKVQAPAPGPCISTQPDAQRPKRPDDFCADNACRAVGGCIRSPAVAHAEDRAGVEMLLVRVAEDLKRALKAAGLRQCDVACRLGVSEAEISNRLSGERNLTLSTLREMADLADLRVIVSFKERSNA